MAFTNFYVSESKVFDVIVYRNSASLDISSDNVTLYLKKNINDTEYAFTASADCASSGSDGVAKFDITPDETINITPNIYRYEIALYVSASGYERVLEQGNINLMKRVK